MNNIYQSTVFNSVATADIPRSSHDLSHTVTTTFNASYLNPIFVHEVLPGDTFNVDMAAFVRLATPLKPIMDTLELETFFFFTPNRLVWSNWQKFCGEQENPGDSTDYTIPTCLYTVTANTMQDYAGLPLGSLPAVNNLPFRAMNLIYNQWFRDENLMDSLTVPVDDGPDTAADFVLFKRRKLKDYFTGCLPFPQKGPAVTLPLGTVAPVKTLADSDYGGPQPALRFKTAATGTFPATDRGVGVSQDTGYLRTYAPPPTLGEEELYPYNLVTDLSTAAAATINELRLAFQVQRLYERDARSGTRYIEINLAHFGVVSPDARLQRPEYLGGGRTYINIHPVAQSAGSGIEGEATPQGNLAAFGTASGGKHGFIKSFVEHGYVIGFVNVRAKLTYQQGIERFWSRQTRFDFAWPVLSHVGEQAVLNQEIYAQPAGTAANTEVFGYQERYAEYRYVPSRVAGTLRSTAPSPIDYWGLWQEFGALPVLNDVFVSENVPMERIKAVTSEPDFLGDFYFKFIAARPLPARGTPGLVDHF